MHRLMVTSRAYRQSSTVTDRHEQADPDNALVSRMPLRRLDAECLYDSLAFVAGQMDDTQFGPGTEVHVRSDGLITPDRSRRGWRRLVYVQQRRKQLSTHLETFDYPQMNPNCIERRESLVAPQALHLMNDGLVFQFAERFADRLRDEAGEARDRQLHRAFWIAFGRPPTDAELELGLDAMDQLTAAWDREDVAQGRPTPSAARRGALTAICHALMNSANFLYVD